MTDQSRVEAVARALAESTGWVWDGLREDQKGYWVECAQAAIEATDAWLKERHEPALWAASDQIRQWTSIRDLAFHEPGLPHALARDCVGRYLEVLPTIEPQEPDK